MATKRKRLPIDCEAAVLEDCRRRCCLCHHLDDDLDEKQGQVAHIDHDPTNNKIGNLVFLCLRHHSLYDSRTSQHKNYTSTEIRNYKRRLQQRLDALFRAEKQQIRFALVLDGTYEECKRPHVEAIAEHLRKLLQNPSITITRVDAGSVIVTVESSAAAFERLAALMRRDPNLQVDGRRVVAFWRLDDDGPHEHPVENLLRRYHPILLEVFMHHVDSTAALDLARRVLDRVQSSSGLRYRVLVNPKRLLAIAQMVLARYMRGRSIIGEAVPALDYLGVDGAEILKISERLFQQLPWDQQQLLERYWSSRFGGRHLDERSSLCAESIEEEITLQVLELI